MTKDEAREILIRYNDWRRYGKPDPINLAIDCAIQALGDGWVSVDESLPKPDTTVIVCNGEGVYIGHYDNYYEGEPEWTYPNEGQEIKVTHWQPLPSPPKPKQP